MPRKRLEGNTIFSYQWVCVGGGVICGFHFFLYAFLYFPNFLFFLSFFPPELSARNMYSFSNKN